MRAFQKIWTIQNQFETKRNSGKATVSFTKVVEKKEKRGMRLPLLIAGAVASAVAITAVFAQSASNDGSAPTRKRYLPEYTESDDLILPKNFNEWVFVGSPLTPNALNDGNQPARAPARLTVPVVISSVVALNTSFTRTGEGQRRPISRKQADGLSVLSRAGAKVRLDLHARLSGPELISGAWRR